MIRPIRAVAALMVLLTALAGLIAPYPTDMAAQSPTPASAESFPALTQATVDFPKGIRVTGTLDVSGLALDTSASVDLLYRIGVDETLHLVTAQVNPGTTAAETQVDVVIDMQSSFVPAGVDLALFWRVSLADGGHAESQPTPVSWFDNRWDWQSIGSSQVTLRYFDLDPAFAESILDSAQSTVTDLETRFALGRSAPISIWVYPTAEAFRGAQQPNSREAVAGGSYPGFFLITAVIPDGNEREIGRVIPHEVSHQVLYQATRNPFTLPPLWFDEGMATHYQIGGTEGYLEMVVRAHEQDRLFDIGSLSVSFPYSPEQATLAYATSWSIIAYIEEIHGDEAIAALIRTFGTGVPYPVAIEEALGLSTDQVNTDWQSWVAQLGQMMSLDVALVGQVAPATSTLSLRVPAEPGDCPPDRSAGCRQPLQQQKGTSFDMYWTKRHVMVCTAVHCNQKGAMDVAGRLRLEIIRKGLDTEILVNNCGTIDLCDIGPNIVVYPDNIIYRGVQVKDIKEIVEHLRGGPVVERLLLSEDTEEERNRRAFYSDATLESDHHPEDKVTALAARFDLDESWIAEQVRRGFMARKPDPGTGEDRLHITKKARARYSV